MTKSTEDKYLEWLEREEETLGLDTLLRASEDIEYARVILKQELGYDPSDAQVDAFFGIAGTKYEALPAIKIAYSTVNQWWGSQSVYRDVETGRFISKAEVERRLHGEE